MEQTVEAKKGITGSTLKIIAIVAMFIDHFAAVILDGYLQTTIKPEMTYQETVQWLADNGVIYYTDTAMRLIGRFGFPLFCFLLVEGFTHTSHLGKYIRNLAIFALISELPFDLGFAGKLFYPEYQNVFFTLLIGVLTLTVVKKLGEDRTWSPKLVPLFYVSSFAIGAFILYMIQNSILLDLLYVFNVEPKLWALILIGGVTGLAGMTIISRQWTADQKNSFFFHVMPMIAGALLADLLKTDYSGWGVVVITIMYLFRNNKTKEMAFGCLALTVMSFMEVTAFLMLIPVSKYNGKRGLSLKYFFYAFYPVHILILYLVTLALGYTTFLLK